MKTVFACLAPILLITDFALGQSAPTTLTNGLVAYYGFNGNLNDAVGSNNLQNFGTSFASDRFGNPSNALSVAPTTYLLSQSNIGISGNNERTVSLWLNVASNPIFPNGRLVTWGDNTPSQAFWFVYSGNTPGGLAADYSFQNNNVDPPSLAGSWQHVVYTYSGTLESVRFYINGSQYTNGTDVNNLLGTNSINTLDTPLYVNADNPANPTQLGMEGLMSDLGLWNRALSAAEVNQLYRVQRGPIPVIELVGNNPTTVFKGSVFTDPGASVTDDVDEERTITASGTVDTSILGTYTLTYSATDTDGNNAQSVTRTVDVVLNPAGDEDGDGVTNYREIADGTDPNDATSFNPLSKGLVAYYPFDGDADDESGRSNNLTLLGSSIGIDRFGVSDSSLAVALGHGAVSAENVGISGNQDRTICFWMKPTTNPVWPDGSVVSWGQGGWDLGVGRLCLVSYDAYYAESPGRNLSLLGFYADSWVLANPTNFLNNWQSVVVVYSGSQVNTKYYVNGVLQTKNFEAAVGEPNISTFDTIDTPLALNAGSSPGGYGNNGGITGFMDEVRIYNRPLTETEVEQLYYAEAFNDTHRTFLSANPTVQGHYSQAEYDANRTNGQTDVTSSPSAFSLFTTAQYDANRTAGRQDVLSDPASYNLYTSASIMDLSMGGLMIQKQGNNAVVSFQPQTTADLTQPYTNYGLPITSTITMPGDKGFIRIQARPYPTPSGTPPIH